MFFVSSLQKNMFLSNDIVKNANLATIAVSKFHMEQI
tara:strand:+ start:234 stop:344 length:111 start_codon:yes stop_codon:yes gene_type:complete